MSDFEVTVPGVAPRLNSTYRVVHVGDKTRLAKKSEVTVWQDTVAWLVRGVKPAGWTPARRVMITIEWYMPRKRDCDAGLKACLDGVAVGLGMDDAAFLVCVPVNEVDKQEPRTVIRIENQP